MKLTDEYLEIVSTINNNLYPLLCRLKEKGLIRANHTVTSLHPDYTKFLVKQFETEMSEKDILEDEKTLAYKMIVSLHAMTSALDLVTNYNLSAAIGNYNQE